mmetsp:Transcript_16049/g.23738  ORF Transcript_16049/g.23738 Transcript_16049/m.23738 type:complete len:81 (+) Transcript_16049:2527-2769(+)
MTAIISAFRIVERRWAITIVVRFCLATTVSKASCTINSDSLSKADVASSNNKILGFETRTRAIATRCFCPPLNCAPLSPT